MVVHQTNLDMAVGESPEAVRKSEGLFDYQMTEVVGKAVTVTRELPIDGARVGVRNVVGLIAAPGGGGYQLVGADGGVYAFGDGNFLGSMSGRLARPAVGGTAA